MSGIELGSIWQSKTEPLAYVEVVAFHHAGAMTVRYRGQERAITLKTLRRNYYLIGGDDA